MQRPRRLVRVELLARGLLAVVIVLSAEPDSGQAASASPAAVAAPSGGFAIVDGPNGPELEAVPFADGETVVLETGGEDGTLGVLLPPTAPGMSGDLWKAGAKQRLVLRSAGGSLSVMLAGEGGNAADLLRHLRIARSVRPRGQPGGRRR